MEERSTDLCVIFAGYKDRMDQFFSYIPGMQSRVNLHIVSQPVGRARPPAPLPPFWGGGGG
jgi:hypothetical protein